MGKNVREFAWFTMARDLPRVKINVQSYAIQKAEAAIEDVKYPGSGLAIYLSIVLFLKQDVGNCDPMLRIIHITNIYNGRWDYKSPKTLWI